jgi:predicted nucleic acid-binding protein
MFAATDLATDHRFGIWDAVIVCAAAAAGAGCCFRKICSRLTWSGVTIVNPFAPVKHAVLDAMLKGGAS